MLDFSNKEFVRSFSVSNLREERMVEKREVILGRTYIKLGKACATTMVTDCWKVWDSSVKQFKYVYLGGVARQHPYDSQVKYADGVEIAHQNAMTNPVFKLVYDAPISFEWVEQMMWSYIEGLPVELIKTRAEKDFANLHNNLYSVDGIIPEYIDGFQSLERKHIDWMFAEACNINSVVNDDEVIYLPNTNKCI